MKSFSTLPSDGGFFDRYATLIPTLYRLGFLAQIVSALTEIGIIYSIIYKSLADFWPAYAATAGGVGAVVGTLFLEIGLRQFCPYSVRAVLHRRFAGLDMAMTIFIFLATVGLLCTSGALSFGGSKDLVENVAPVAEQRTTTAADSTAQAARALTLDNYRADSLEIAQRYQAQQEAVRVSFGSKIDVQRAELRKYSNFERSRNQSFGSKKASIRTTIEQLEADRDGEAAALEMAKAGELSEISKEKKGGLAAINSAYTARVDSVQQFNAGAVAKIERKVSNYGGGLAWFTVICLVVFVLSVTLNEIHRKGSGMDQRILPTQYDFSDSIVNEAFHALGNRYQQLVRTKIANFEANTAAPPLPVAASELYNLGGLAPPVYEVNFEELPEDQRRVFIGARPPVQENTGTTGTMTREEAEKMVLEYLAASVKLESENFHDLAADLQLRADQVLKMYLGPEGNPDAVAELRAGCLEFLNNTGPNPFAHHHRQRIGFKWGNSSASDSSTGDGTGSVSNATVSNASSGAGKGSKMGAKDCLQCGNIYQPKVAWQKYCSQGCKEDFHAEKHGGKRFDPQAFNRTRK